MAIQEKLWKSISRPSGNISYEITYNKCFNGFAATINKDVATNIAHK
jgi:hypothetical protein